MSIEDQRKRKEKCEKESRGYDCELQGCTWNPDMKVVSKAFEARKKAVEEQNKKLVEENIISVSKGQATKPMITVVNDEQLEEQLKNRAPENAIWCTYAQGGGSYQHKYLKYKSKYLALKNSN